MTKRDLKVGMVVELKTLDDDGSFLCIVMSTEHDGMCLSGEAYWCPLDTFDEGLMDKRYNRFITNIYGFSSSVRRANQCITNHRKLLWKREELKELTVSEIEKLLGYPVKIVRE